MAIGMVFLGALIQFDLNDGLGSYFLNIRVTSSPDRSDLDKKYLLSPRLVLNPSSYGCHC